MKANLFIFLTLLFLNEALTCLPAATNITDSTQPRNTSSPKLPNNGEIIDDDDPLGILKKTPRILTKNEVGIITSTNKVATNTLLQVPSGQIKAPQFPTEFTNRAGVVYRNIRVQQPSPEGIMISYDNDKNVRRLDVISLKELSPELQDYYGYDPNNPAVYEERERQRRASSHLSIMELEQAWRKTEQRKREEEKEADQKWFARFKAEAEKGDVQSQSALGACFAIGKGVEKNVAEAVKWYRKAAFQNYAPAQTELGIFCVNGNGVLKDQVEGYKWFLLAAAQGDEDAKYNISQLERWLTQEQIAEAQKLARHFKPRKASESNGPVSGDEVSDTQPTASGTGFFISTGGYLISNNHVVAGANQIRLVTSAGLISAKVIKVDVANDLALLKAEGRFAPLPLSPSRGVKLGGTVATVGFPNIGLQGFAPKLAKGEIASLSGAGDDARYFQISVPVQPGNSGGALVDEHGNVVGVVSAKLNASAALAMSGTLPENVNYAVKSSYLLSFLESVPDVASKLKEPSTMEKKFEDVVKEAEQAAVLVLVY